MTDSGMSADPGTRIAASGSVVSSDRLYDLAANFMRSQYFRAVGRLVSDRGAPQGLYPQMEAQAPRRRRQPGGSRRPAVHPSTAEPSIGRGLEVRSHQKGQ